MKIELIKKQIKRKMLRYLPAVGILLVVFIGAEQYDSYNQDRLKAAQDKVNSLSGQIIKIKTDYDDAEKILKTYMAIEKNKFPTDDGYAAGRDRLRALLPIVRELKDLYDFKTLNLTLGEIKQNTTSGIQGFKVYENSIELDFSGLTDEVVYSFLEDLKHEIPGYVNVKTFQMARVSDINSANADAYFTKHDVEFVNGKMELEWATMQNDVKVVPEKPADSAAATPAEAGAPAATNTPIQQGVPDTSRIMKPTPRQPAK